MKRVNTPKYVCLNQIKLIKDIFSLRKKTDYKKVEKRFKKTTQKHLQQTRICEKN